MKLLNDELLQRFEKFPLHSQEHEGENAIVICKFFSPVGGWTWFVTEGEEEDGDFIFFGYVINYPQESGEYGYFSRNELESVKLPFGLGIERDLYFDETTIGKVLKIE